jgi:hypothetical protein
MKALGIKPPTHNCNSKCHDSDYYGCTEAIYDFPRKQVKYFRKALLEAAVKAENNCSCFNISEEQRPKRCTCGAFEFGRELRISAGEKA